MSSLGAPSLRARSFQAENQKAIPQSGRSPEAIWHLVYDTKTYTDNSTVSLNFFDSTNVGSLDLSNMELAGQFPAPQVFDIHGVFCDLWATAAGVSTSATTVGNLNDIYLLQFVGRPRWTLTIQQKNYGPYPLITLHGLGAPVSQLSQTVATVSQQAASNDRSPGWNYNGSITIPSQTAFQFNITWAAAQDLTANWLIRIGMTGKLSRAVK
jgi:hypothetical protein